MLSGARRDKAYADPNIGFAWLRLIGATLVVIDHSSPLLNPERLTIFPASWNVSPGYIALMAFFAMSGYQINDSWERDPSWVRFGARRLLRILPPLIFVVMVTVFVIGPLLTVIPLADYWSSRQTWRYLVGTPLLFLLQHELPGVFDTNPYPWSVNGSLWTLPMEFVGYAIVLFVGLAVVVGATRFVVIPVLALIIVLDSFFQATFSYGGDAGSLIEIPIGSLVAFMVPFAFGMTVHTFRTRIPYSRVASVVLSVAWLSLIPTPFDRYVLPFMAGFGAIVIAHHWPGKLKVDGRWIFGSYGMYIWAFPIQQMLIYAGVDNQWVLMMLAVPAAYVAGTLSWCFIEAPTQRLRKYLRGTNRTSACPIPSERPVEVTTPLDPVDNSPVHDRN